MRGSLWLLVLGALGCGDPTPPPATRSVVEQPAMAPVEAAPEVDEARIAAAAALSDWLSGCAVSADAFARHKLYTWTRPAQIEELRARRPRLLSRARGASGEQSLFDQAIADDDHPLARRLRRPPG